MSIFSHNIYENVRTRTIVLHENRILLIPVNGPADFDGTVWRLPGGGLEPHETLAECARREVLEETGISVHVGRVAFLLEWVVPQYTIALEAGEGHGFGLEIFHYAYPEDGMVEPRPEIPGGPIAKWVPFDEVSSLPLWPKELRPLCNRLQAGQAPDGAVSVIGHIESPVAPIDYDPF